MKLKDKIKKEIDMIPDEYLPQLERYVEVIKSGKSKDKRIGSLHLKGRFDDMNIRKVAYE